MRKDPCREMFTRACPASGCKDLPCARFEDDDESRWAAEIVEWTKDAERRGHTVTTQKVWYHRAVLADKTIRETPRKPVPESGMDKVPCLAKLSQTLMQGEYPGVIVEHIEEEVLLA
jgi:hypothetical protein